MSCKTIAKFLSFVIFLSVLLLNLSGCGLVASSVSKQPVSDGFDPPKVVGHIANPDVTESSGLAASKCQPDVFWTHNDSGDDAFIFAINSKGDDLGTWRVRNAENKDWEDIAEFKDAEGKCFIYIGDIGDNDRKREVHAIYRVAEPAVSSDSANRTRKNALETEPAESVNFSYADTRQNAETLLVHPSTGDIYVLTKHHDQPSGVYKIAPVFGTADIQKVGRVAELKVPSVPDGLLTGGDISPDGRHIVICDYTNGYELTLPADDANFDDIWKQAPVTIDLGERAQGEAVSYSQDGNTIYATSEKKNPPIIEVRRK